MSESRVCMDCGRDLSSVRTYRAGENRICSACYLKRHRAKKMKKDDDDIDDTPIRSTGALISRSSPPPPPSVAPHSPPRRAPAAASLEKTSLKRDRSSEKVAVAPSGLRIMVAREGEVQSGYLRRCVLAFVKQLTVKGLHEAVAKRYDVSSASIEAVCWVNDKANALVLIDEDSQVKDLPNISHNTVLTVSFKNK